MLVAMDPQKPSYDFIMNNGQPVGKKPLLPGNGSSMTQRIIVVGAVVCLLFIILGIILSVATSKKGGASQTMIDLVSEQQELARVADFGAQKSTVGTTRSYAYIVKLSTSSDQQRLIAYLRKQHVKVNTKILNAKKNGKTDQDMAAAQSAGQFDVFFLQLLQEQVRTYQKDVKAAYDTTTQKSAKAVLADSYNGINVLAEGGAPAGP